MPEESKVPTAIGKPGKPKGKFTSASKRRKTTSAGPTLSRKDEDLVTPDALNITQGWTVQNTKLFEAWGLHYRKLVHRSETLAEEDVVSLLEIDKNRLDEYQAALGLQEKQRLEEQR